MDDPSGNVCRRFFWACQDANYNVLGLVNHIGLLSERYEYSPYGERKVFSRGWLLSDLNGDGSANSSDTAVFSSQNGMKIATNDPLVRRCFGIPQQDF